MIKVKFADYMRREEKGFSIERLFGSGDYLFLYFPYPMNWKGPDGAFETKKNASVLLSPEDPGAFSGAPDFVNSYIHFMPEGENILLPPTGRIFYPENYREINALVRRIRDERFCELNYSEYMTDALMRELLASLCREAEGKEKDPLRSDFEKIRAEYLSGLCADATVDELAKKMCMSRSQFFSCYKQFFNSSPKKDLLKMRMERAEMLLSDRSKSVAEVAKLSGFLSPEHFTRYYKSYWGHPPRREKIGQNINKKGF